MPTPGTTALQDELGDIAFTIKEKHETTIKKTSSTIIDLSAALDTGWKSKTPDAATDMATSFNAQFMGVLMGDGLAFMNAIAVGIDKEVGLWVSSFDPITTLHKYIPTAATVEQSILALVPFESDGNKALVKKVSSVFADNFDGAQG